MKFTKKERQIAEMIAQGLDNDAIIDKLCIAVSTLKTHINHIYKKLNIKRSKHTNDCRSLVVAKLLNAKVELADKKLELAERLHKESLIFMTPNINVCRKFLEIYQNKTACIDCPVLKKKRKCETRKTLCLKRLWELIK